MGATIELHSVVMQNSTGAGHIQICNCIESFLHFIHELSFQCNTSDIYEQRAPYSVSSLSSLRWGGGGGGVERQRETVRETETERG